MADGIGCISDQWVLDLRSAKTPEDLAHITSIKDVGVVLIPERLAAALARIPASGIGAVVQIPHDPNVHWVPTTVTAKSVVTTPEATTVIVQTTTTYEVTP